MAEPHTQSQAPAADAGARPASHHAIRSSFEAFELQFRRNYPLLWRSSIVGPILLTLVILTAIGLVHPEGWVMVQKIVIAGVVTFAFFSRLVILGGEQAPTSEALSFLTTDQLYLLVMYMDLMMAVLVTFHIGLMFRLPYVGEKLGQLVADGAFILHTYPRIRRAAFVGLMLFVMMPFAATGCIGGAILGRLLGMGRIQVLAALTAGSIAGNTLIYLGATRIDHLVNPDNPYLWEAKMGLLVLIVLALVAIERYFQVLKKRTMAASRPAPPKTPR